MKDRVKLSEVASYCLYTVKQRLNLGGQDDYIPARIALGRSLQTGREPEIGGTVEVPERDRRRKEIPLTTLEQGHRLYFQALLSQRHRRKVEEDEYVDTLTRHVEHGLWLIFQETEKVKGYDYLAVLMGNGSFRPGSGKAEAEKPASPAAVPVLRMRIGTDKATQQPVQFDWNVANNPHVALMGGSGAGKTYFLKHLLRELRRESQYETHFVIFDYKDGDIANDADFVLDTQAEVLRVSSKPLPLNPFAGVGASDREQRSVAERLVQIVRDVEANIGKVQENNLYQAILSAYQTASPYPDFRDIRAELDLLSPRPDSLTSVLRPLVDQHYFAFSNEPIYQQWTNKTLVVDIHDIERKDLVCFFVLRQIFEELKRLGPAPFDETTKARQLRIVVVLDEAHNFLESKKRSSILAKMIREVRSSGGAVVLASQSPDDYDKADFNFLELVEYPIVLKSNPSSPKFLEQKFSLSPKAAKELLLEVGKLGRGEGFVMEAGKVKGVKLTS